MHLVASVCLCFCLSVCQWPLSWLTVKFGTENDCYQSEKVVYLSVIWVFMWIYSRIYRLLIFHIMGTAVRKMHRPYHTVPKGTTVNCTIKKWRGWIIIHLPGGHYRVPQVLMLRGPGKPVMEFCTCNIGDAQPQDICKYGTPPGTNAS